MTDTPLSKSELRRLAVQDPALLVYRCDRLIKHLEIARSALQEIAKYHHAGEGGFCYEPHGTRACSCWVGDARRALKEMGD